MIRFIDIFFSATLIILLLPISIPIVIILRFSGEGDVFYLQKRSGFGGKEFYILKFATMLRDSVNSGNGSITVENDYRVTSIGKFLRKTKINELPQLWNILIGDMTIVGPRPLIKGTTGYNSYSNDQKDKIFSNKPGLTGIASLIFRDEEKFLSSAHDPHTFYIQEVAPYKIELELWYYKHKSIKTDIKIIFLTAISIFYSNNKLYLYFFKNIPVMPKNLSLILNKGIN